MTTLLQQIEALRIQVNELANGEHGMVKALREALCRADHQLLHDVRNVTAEHEVRREVILKELHTLAARIGMFPDPREPLTGIEEAPRNLSAYATASPDHHVINRGGWREAANNIHDELDFHLNGGSPAH